MKNLFREVLWPLVAVLAAFVVGGIIVLLIGVVSYRKQIRVHGSIPSWRNWSGPLNRIASGGELSRFLLALKVCLKGDTPGLTMIFDEIDRGLGGATANAVGRRLKDLASTAQVLVVTHSPQVAALGTHHWRVEKRVTSGRTISTVVALSPQERVEEIARMLAGDTVTDAARQAARSLLGHG